MKKIEEMQKIAIKKLYFLLYEHYGPQGWWPIIELEGHNSNPTNRGEFRGYHPEDYTIPNNEMQMFEVMLGAILTQNTSWSNAEKALKSLKKNIGFLPKKIMNTEHEELAEIIRSSGYYNQKARRLKTLSKYILKHPIRKLNKKKIPALRKELLNLKGVGPETADSMILYGLKKPIFVVDAYSKRLLYRLGILSSKKANYKDIQELFHRNIPRDFIVYNEYHALIVQHCAKICKRSPKCEGCPFLEYCIEERRNPPKNKNKAKKKK